MKPPLTNAPLLATAAAASLLPRPVQDAQNLQRESPHHNFLHNPRAGMTLFAVVVVTHRCHLTAIDPVK